MQERCYKLLGRGWGGGRLRERNVNISVECIPCVLLTLENPSDFVLLSPLCAFYHFYLPRFLGGSCLPSSQGSIRSLSMFSHAR